MRANYCSLPLDLFIEAKDFAILAALIGTGSSRQVGLCRTIMVYSNTARASPIIRHDAFIR